MLEFGGYVLGALLGSALGDSLGARKTVLIGASAFAFAALPIAFNQLRRLRHMPVNAL